LKNKYRLIIVVGFIIAVIFGSVVGVKCGFSGNPEAEDRPAVTAPEIVEELIKQEKEKLETEEKAEDKSEGHASATPSETPPPTKPLGR
jgi:hypothetical protein